MTTIVLFLIWVAILIIFIVGLVKSTRSKEMKLWLGLFVAEFVMVFVARGMATYYDSLPGYGFMPGLTYLGEFLFCYVASWVYVIMLAISLIIYFIVKRKFENRK